MTLQITLLPSYNITMNEYEINATSDMMPLPAGQKIAAASLSVFLVLCAIYMVITLSCYEHQRTLIIPNDQNRRNVCYSKTVRILCLCSAIFAFLRYVTTMVEIFESEFKFSPCVWVRQVKLLTLAVSAMCAYSVLWLRQWHFYKDPGMKYAGNNATKSCSFAAIFLMIASATIPVIRYLTTSTFVRTDSGCKDLSPTVWPWLPAVLYHILVISFQINLIGLFIYPLWKYNQHKSDDNRRLEDLRLNTNNINRSFKDLMQMIKRVRNATIVSVVTTSVIGIISIPLFYSSVVYDVWLHLVIDVDIMVNLLSVLCSFRDWKRRLIAPFWDEKVNTVTERECENIQNHETNV